MDFKTLDELRELLPCACVDACTACGDNAAAVADWVDKLSLNWPRQECIAALEPYGAWSDEELGAMTNEELLSRVLWVAAGIDL